MTERKETISRRTLAKGVAWAAPTVAVGAAAPAYAASPPSTTTTTRPTTTTTTRPPCVGDIAATGGSYPVSISLSGCATASSHWDFRFRITASATVGDCNCPFLRVTFFDNPKRSRLWISPSNPGNVNIGTPTSNTANSPRLYVQKILAAGTSAEFPATGDRVVRVAGSAPFDGFTTGGTFVGTILAAGEADDSLHVLILPDGSVPCAATGPMAFYRVECGQSAAGPWSPLGGLGQINPCVPQIQSTVCTFDTTGNDRYRLGISVLTSCGLPASTFRITNIQRNNDTNFPTAGTSVWTGNQALSAGVTNIDMTGTGSGGQLWISFTTDGGLNTSQIRVPTNNTACPATTTTSTTTSTTSTTSTTLAPPTGLRVTSNTCTGGTRTIGFSWTGTATRFRSRRTSNLGGGESGDWTSYTAIAAGTNSRSFSASDNGCNSRFEVEVCNGTSCATVVASA